MWWNVSLKLMPPKFLKGKIILNRTYQAQWCYLTSRERVLGMFETNDYLRIHIYIYIEVPEDFCTMHC